MPATMQQLQEQLDALVAQLSAPAEVAFSDRRIRNRSIAELNLAITSIQDQMAALGGAPSRVSLAQHKRGDGPTGPDRCRW